MDWTWLLALASLIATIANIHKRRWCFAVWICTNLSWAVYDASIHEYSQSALFACYAVLAAWGIVKWRK